MRRHLLALVLSSLVHSGAAVAATFSAPLTDLIGVVDFVPSHPTLPVTRTASFDVGQRFSAIERVWMEVEAHVVAEEFDVCGTTFDPQPCVHNVVLQGFFALMDEQESAKPGLIFTSPGLFFLGSPGPISNGPRDASGVATAPFSNTLVGWDFLLDGESSVILGWNPSVGNPDLIVLNYQPPTGEIFDARIFIEGTPVPEPSTALLVAAGLLTLAWHRVRRSPWSTR